MRIELFSKRNMLGKRRWYFRVRAKNGEPIAQSEGYSRRIDAMSTAHLLRDKLGQAVVVDE